MRNTKAINDRSLHHKTQSHNASNFRSMFSTSVLVIAAGEGRDQRHTMSRETICSWGCAVQTWCAKLMSVF